MKFIFICVALVCANLYFCRAGNTSRNQKVCLSPNTPININIHSDGGHRGAKGEKGEKGDHGEKGAKGTPCKCLMQNPKKPSAHIEGHRTGVTYRIGTVIKDWSVSAPNSHLSGGMKYRDGKLIVPTSGRYYIYSQIYHRNNGRIYVRVNNKIVTLTQPLHNGRGESSMYTGGVFNLKACDAITLVGGEWPTTATVVYMGTYHSYFGEFLI